MTNEEQFSYIQSALDIYLKEVSKIKPLSAEDEKNLVERIQIGDNEALEILVTSNLEPAIKVAAHYAHLGVPFEDLISASNIALIKAAKRFKPGKKERFIHHATWWIKNEITAQFAQISRSTTIPIDIYKKGRKLLRKIDNLEQKKGSPVALSEIAELFDTEIEMIEEIIGTTQMDDSLDTPAEGTDDPGITKMDMLVYEDEESPHDISVNSILGDSIAAALDILSAKESQIIKLTFGIGVQPHTLEETAEKLHMNSRKVKDLKKRALYKLRDLIPSSFASTT